MTFSVLKEYHKGQEILLMDNLCSQRTEKTLRQNVRVLVQPHTRMFVFAPKNTNEKVSRRLEKIGNITKDLNCLKTILSAELYLPRKALNSKWPR
jgi:hypothetical protein